MSSTELAAGAPLGTIAELRVCPSVLRHAAAALTDLAHAGARCPELGDALTALLRDAAGGWASVRAARVAGEAATDVSARLASGLADLAVGLHAAADGYHAVDERSAARLTPRGGPQRAGAHEW